MSQPYVGEIRMFAGNFAPAGWMLCQGQLLNISDYETLFNLIGTTYGGDGQTTFALPNLASRVPIHFGQGPGVSFNLAESGGSESVTLTIQTMPSHNHPLLATNTFPVDAPNNAFPGVVTSTQAGVSVYGPSTGATVAINPNSIGNAGGSQPHDNMKPFLVVNFILSLFGVFPSQT